MSGRRFQFSYPSVGESEGKFLDDFEAALKQESVEAGLSRRLMLAVSEAFTNALVHGNHRDPGKRILVGLEVNDSEVIADITDEGTGGVGAIARKNPPGPLAEGGRGVDLIRHCASTVSFTERVGGGLTVTIRVRREAKRIVI